MEKPKIRDVIPKKNNGKTNRTKGHNYERQLAKEFREILGDEDCRTSRQSSRLLDDCKVDLDCYFLNIHAKNVRNNINYSELLNDIKEAIDEKLKKRSELPIAIFHKKQSKEMIIISKEDFYKLAIAYKKQVDGS